MPCEIKGNIDSSGWKQLLCKCESASDSDIVKFQFTVEVKAPSLNTEYRLHITMKTDRTDTVKTHFAAIDKFDRSSSTALKMSQITKEQARACARKLFELCAIDSNDQVLINHFLEDGVRFVEKQEVRANSATDILTPAEHNAVRASQPFQNAVSALRDAGRLNRANFLAVQSLHDEGILKLINFDEALKHLDLPHLANTLVALKTAGVELTREIIGGIVQYSSDFPIADMLGYLSNANIVTTANVCFISKCLDPWECVRPFQILGSNLTQRIFYAVVDHFNPAERAQAFVNLKNHGILDQPEQPEQLTQPVFDAVTKHHDPKRFAELLITLKMALAPENFNAVIKHPHFAKVVDAIIELNAAQIPLTPETIYAINLDRLEAIHTLKNADILNLETFDAIKTHPKPSVAAQGICDAKKSMDENNVSWSRFFKPTEEGTAALVWLKAVYVANKGDPTRTLVLFSGCKTFEDGVTALLARLEGKKSGATFDTLKAIGRYPDAEELRDVSAPAALP